MNTLVFIVIITAYHVPRLLGYSQSDVHFIHQRHVRMCRCFVLPRAQQHVCANQVQLFSCLPNFFHYTSSVGKQLTIRPWSGSKRVVNFPWQSSQRSRETYLRNFGVSLRETNRQKKFYSFEKHCVLDLECRILSQEPSESCILYFNVIFHGK